MVVQPIADKVKREEWFFAHVVNAGEGLAEVKILSQISI